MDNVNVNINVKANFKGKFKVNVKFKSKFRVPGIADILHILLIAANAIRCGLASHILAYLWPFGRFVLP